MTIVVPGTGTGTGNQTGDGSPEGVVTPNAAGALYTDQLTGNVWVALSASSSSWVQATGSNAIAATNIQNLTPSVSGTAQYGEVLNGTGYKLYRIVFTAWDDAGQTVIFTTPMTESVDWKLSSNLPSTFAPLAKTSNNLTLAPATGVSGLIVIEGN